MTVWRTWIGHARALLRGGSVRTIDELIGLRRYGQLVGEATIWSCCAHELDCAIATARDLGVTPAQLRPFLEASTKWAAMAGGAARAVESMSRRARPDT